MNKKRLFLMFIVSLFLVSMFIPAANAQAGGQTGMWEALLGPLSDLGEVYDKPGYSMVIDLIIYLVIFIGLAKVTLGAKFQGRGANVLMVGIGILLSASLALWGQASGFNIKSFGPIAAFIIIALLGFTMFVVIKKLTDKGMTAFAWAFVIVYFTFLAVMPFVWEWIMEKAPIIGGILTVIVVGSIFLIGKQGLGWLGKVGHIFKKGEGEEPPEGGGPGGAPEVNVPEPGKDETPAEQIKDIEKAEEEVKEEGLAPEEEAKEEAALEEKKEELAAEKEAEEKTEEEVVKKEEDLIVVGEKWMRDLSNKINDFYQNVRRLYYNPIISMQTGAYNKTIQHSMRQAPDNERKQLLNKIKKIIKDVKKLENIDKKIKRKAKKGRRMLKKWDEKELSKEERKIAKTAKKIKTDLKGMKKVLDRCEDRIKKVKNNEQSLKTAIVYIMGKVTEKSFIDKMQEVGKSLEFIFKEVDKVLKTVEKEEKETKAAT